MSRIFTNILGAIGKTPLVQINNIAKNIDARILVKIESMNPLSSVKDRAALALIDSAEKEGKIAPGKTIIIEATSGNTGIGLAMVCAVKGYRLVLTMPESMSQERKDMFRFLGVELELTDARKGMFGAIKKAKEMSEKLGDTYIPNQFNNKANSKAHYETTGPEIWNDTDGDVDVIVCGIGTGGTITGIGEFVKEKKSSIKIIGVEPKGSAVLTGGSPGPHGIQGIGAGFVPEILDRDVLDEVVTVEYKEALDMFKRLAKEEGIFAGISSGAALCAALDIAKRLDMKNKTIVVILPDTGQRYLSELK